MLLCIFPGFSCGLRGNPYTFHTSTINLHERGWTGCGICEGMNKNNTVKFTTEGIENIQHMLGNVAAIEFFSAWNLINSPTLTPLSSTLQRKNARILGESRVEYSILDLNINYFCVKQSAKFTISYSHPLSGWGVVKDILAIASLIISGISWRNWSALSSKLCICCVKSALSSAKVCEWSM